MRNSANATGSAQASGTLQELLKLGTRKDGLRLLQRLNLLIAGSLAKIEVLENEVAALVQLRVVVRQLLKLKHDGLLRLFRLDEVRLSLCPHFGLLHDVFALRLNRCVRLLHEVLVCLLRILLRADGLRLHSLCIVYDL